VRQLIAAGHRPVVLDNFVYGHRGAVSSSITLHEGDLGNEAFVADVLRREKIEVVMHFAAYCYVGESVVDPLKYYFNNSVATLHLLRAMLTVGVKKFVFSSTCATFGIPAALPIDENLPQAPINPYGQTKLDVEHALKALAHAHGLGFAAFRYFNAAGAAEDGDIGEDHHPETHLIPVAIDVATGKRPHLELFGSDYPTPDGTCLRDYVHVDDLARAHIAVFDRLATPGAQLFYNLGTGSPTSNLAVIRAVEKVTGLKVKVVESPRRAGDPPALYADSAKAMRELGWKVKFPEIEAIVATAWKWHSSHPNGYGDR
jgi:UDP-glucose 4-epimerase